MLDFANFLFFFIKNTRDKRLKIIYVRINTKTLKIHVKLLSELDILELLCNERIRCAKSLLLTF